MNTKTDTPSDARNVETPKNLNKPASGGTKHFLDQAVNMFAHRFKCDACGLFLYDESNRTLTLRAAYGYPMFGKASIVLKAGEGLIGRCLAERRSIYTEMASTMRGYVRHHNFPDDDLQTFLGIPLLYGKERVGAIMLQRRTGVPFLAEEISAARLKAEELATRMQSANAMLLVENAGRPPLESGPLNLTEETTFKGSAVSDGWAMGKVKVMSAANISGLLAENAADYPEPIRSLSEAISIVEERFRQISETLDKRLPEAASMIFETEIMMMHDENYIGKIEKLIESGTPVTKAVAIVSNEFIRFFRKSETEYIREKAHDIEDLALRLLEAVTTDQDSFGEDRASRIIVAEKLLPSDVLQIAQGHILGIILIAGGSTAHVTLLVRSLKIPMIILPVRDLLRLPDGEVAILDCSDETVIVHPDNATLKKFGKRSREEAKKRITYRSDLKEKFTKDGSRIFLNANINIISEINAAADANAEGIGLYRTEIPFMMRQTIPSETDQQAIYTRIMERMPDKPIVFRTLDAGGDKIIPYLFGTKEDNPAMGLRSIRFTLKYPFILDQQLRALLRAIQNKKRTDVSIMFPMITSAEEFASARERVDICMGYIRSEFDGEELITPRVGLMIETPAVIGVLDHLCKTADFFSIGTNDFIQYMLAVDRTNSNVSKMYVPHHPAVLRGIKTSVESALKHNVPISLCGEMGRESHYIPFLIGIGLRNLSLEPTHIPAAQHLISRLNTKDCEEYAAKLLSLSYIAEIDEAISDFTAKFLTKQQS
jgi:phosphotransferase system enzyme I (PtsP)